jgi:hypothetical protein
MSYTPSTDFLGLLRNTGNGVRKLSMPGLDFTLAALARAGMITLWTNPTTAPTINQPTTVWLMPSSTSWAAEGTVFLWQASTQSYVYARPDLWAALFNAALTLSNEIDALSSTVLTAANRGSLYSNSAASAIQYTLPAASAAPGVEYQFVVTQAGQLYIALPVTTEVLRWGITTSQLGMFSYDVGSYVKLRSINGQWYVIGAEGAWTVS